MLERSLEFLNMHGHGKYIWPAYAAVAIMLAVQWLLPYRRWLHYRRHALSKQASAE